MRTPYLIGAVMALMPLAAVAENDIVQEMQAKGQLTVLNLSEQAHKEVAQDKIRASLTYQHRDTTRSRAQDVVNGKMGDALDRAKRYRGMETYTGHYRTHEDRREGIWRASQQITLETKDKDDIENLVADLQERGFTTNGLQYYLSKEAHRAQEDALIDRALNKLKNRADNIGRQLGMPNVHIADVSFGKGGLRSAPPVTHSIGMAMESGSRVQKAAVEGRDQEVSVSIRAVVHLRP